MFSSLSYFGSKPATSGTNGSYPAIVHPMAGGVTSIQQAAARSWILMVANDWAQRQTRSAAVRCSKWLDLRSTLPNQP